MQEKSHLCSDPNHTAFCIGTGLHIVLPITEKELKIKRFKKNQMLTIQTVKLVELTVKKKKAGGGGGCLIIFI